MSFYNYKCDIQFQFQVMVEEFKFPGRKDSLWTMHCFEWCDINTCDCLVGDINPDNYSGVQDYK